MALTFLNSDGNPITGDFTTVVSGETIQVPYENLLVWDNATLSQYGITKVVTENVPQVISDRQFFQQLAVMGVITEAEALAAIGPGTIPAALLAFIAALAPADQFPAKMLLSGATQFERGHPMVVVFGNAFGWSGPDIDAFWTEAYKL